MLRPRSDPRSDPALPGEEVHGTVCARKTLEETYTVYLLDWTVVGGLHYVGMTTDLEARIEKHRTAGVLPFQTLGEPEVSILADGLDVYSAAVRERREIGERRTMTPSGYNHSAGGEYSGARRDKFLGAAHVERLARATVAVAHLAGNAHEADARKLVAQGTGKVLEHYLAACSVVAGMVHQGDHPMKIGRKTGLGTGQIYGMLRDIGENPPPARRKRR